MTTVESLRYRAYRHHGGRVDVVPVEASWRQLTHVHDHVALIQPRYTGICSADIRELRGERPGRSDFGHEVVGTVLRCTHPMFRDGDSVVMNPFVKTDRETAFAEMMYLATSDALVSSALVKVPSDDLQFALAEPLACAIHAARRSALQETGPRLVLGAGFFGYLLYHYLEYVGVPVALANRSSDRLTDLAGRIPTLCTLPNLEEGAGNFVTVFLTQSRLSRDDVGAAAHLLRDHGEAILFGAFDPSADPQLHVTRKQQERVLVTQNGKRFYAQGTLDASLTDLQEAVAVLSRVEFARKLAPILAAPLSFKQGADHLMRRASSPRSLRKYMIDMRS